MTAPSQTADSAEPQTVALEVLTDEELSVLTEDAGVVVSPVLESVPAPERDAVRRTAFRSLVARGIVEAPDSTTTAEPTGTGDAAVELRIRNDVLSALTLRRSASAVLAVARTTASGQDFWYAHVVHDVALLEQVGSDGLHRFAIGHSHDLGELLIEAAIHPDATDGHGDGGDVELAVAPDGEAPAELLDRIGRSYLRADVMVVVRSGAQSPDRPTLTGLFTGPEGSWSIVARPGSQRAWARPESTASLAERARAVAAEAVAAGVPGAGLGARTGVGS